MRAFGECARTRDSPPLCQPTQYIVSDGGGRPYRIRVRPPCFIAMGAFHEMIKGYMVADIVPTFGMVNMIGGECDR